MATNKKTPNNIEFDCSLSQDSLAYLKINKQPFAIDILTETTFFSFLALEKIIENLQHQVQFSDLLLIIEGPYGSGKTTLFRHLTHNEIENTKLLPIQAEATDTLVQIQQKISELLQDLGNANYLDDNLKSLQSFNQTPLVVIDNTHVLSDTTLQELLRYKDQLKHEHDVNLKFILFANSGISSTLEKITELDSNQMYVQSMPAYTDKLTAELITHKFRIAGYTSESLLNESELQLIDKNNNGSPLGVMHNASVIIDKNIAKTLNPPSPLWLKILIALIVLSIVSIAASIYFGILDTKKFISKIEQTPEPTPIFKEISLPPADNERTIKPVLAKNTTVEDAKLSDNSIERLDTRNPIKNGTDKETGTALLVDNNEAKDPELPASTNQTNESTIKPLVIETVETDIVSTKKPIQKTLTESKTTPEVFITKKVEKPKVVRDDVNKKEKTAAIHPALKQLNTMGVHDTSWLLKQKDTEWTLQLLGAREPETLLTFSRQHALSQKAAWYKTWLKGKPYYVLVYGNYSSRDQARGSIAKLPEKLRFIKPWAKSIKSVQQSIK